MTRTVTLEVNDRGAWKRVMSADLDTFEDGDLELHAQQLLELSDNPRLRARIIMPGDTAPLVTWSLEDGWREYVSPARRAA